MSERRATRYRIIATLVDPFGRVREEMTCAHSRRVKAVRRAQQIALTWPSARTVEVLDSYTGARFVRWNGFNEQKNGAP